MEVVRDGGVRRDDLVEVAFADNFEEGELLKGLLDEEGIDSALFQVGLSGPMLGIGLLPRSAQRLMVRSADADRGRRLLEQWLSTPSPEPSEAELEPTYEREDPFPRRKRGPRDYGVVTGYAYAYLAAAIVLAVAFGTFLLLRAH